ncbi:MAG: hypothetical protein U0176_04630 [Bacteroidia bacterium]
MPRAHSKAIPWPKLAPAIWITALWVGAFFCPNPSFSQSKFQQFRNLPGPVKSWVIGHIWTASKAQRLTNIALQALPAASQDPRLDHDPIGGRLDAFRHGYWMALLGQEFRAGKARSLGRAYERSNYLQWKRGQLEDGGVQDSCSSKMDLLNNEVGIRIGRVNREIGNAELAGMVMDSVAAGAFWVISKDSDGRSLDAQGNELPDSEWKGKWVNRRILLRSNALRP